MTAYLSYETIKAAADYIQARVQTKPKVGMILGSGLGGLADMLEAREVVPYQDIPHWPVSTVHGHTGQLVFGRLEGQPVMGMQGRAHFYEGYSMAEIGLPVRVMKLLGAEIMIVTNAAGAVNPAYEPGDVMLITDHLNLIGMAGANPLRGPNIDAFGPRFPDMSQPYDWALEELARQVAHQNGARLHEGVYVGLAGPSFETPAELRYLRSIGVDAVGMSTVPEVITARHCDLRVLGFSGISNKANLDGKTKTTHEEVLESGRVLVPKLMTLIRGVLQAL